VEIRSTGADREARRQIRGSSLLLSGRVISLGLNLLTQVLIVRTLSKEGYGVFAYALSVATIGEGIVGLGLHRAIARYVPIFDEDGDRSRMLGTIVLALGATLGAGLAAVLLVLGLRATLVGDLAAHESAIPVLIILSFLAPLQGVDRILLGLFSVFGRARAIFVRRFLLGPVLRLLVVGALLWRGGGVEFLAVGYVAAGAIGIAVYGAVLVSFLRARRILAPGAWREMRIPAREIFTFALPLLTTEIVFVGINHADSIMLGQMAGPEDVASLRAVYPVARLNQVVLEMFAILFTPLAARLYRRQDWEGIRQLYWRTATWIAVLSFPLFAATFSLARPLTTSLFGERYAGSAVLLALLTFGYYAHAALGPNGMLLNVYRLLRYAVIVNIVALCLNIVGNLVMIPRFGAKGAALATAGTLLIHNLLKQNGLRRARGIRPFAPTATRPYATIGGGLVILVAVEAAWSPPWPLALAVAAIVSSLVLIVNRGALDLVGTFPEIRQLPGASWLAQGVKGEEEET
jgi:O-antigen/teichoic acid export membrane protein